MDLVFSPCKVPTYRRLRRLHTGSAGIANAQITPLAYMCTLDLGLSVSLTSNSPPRAYTDGLIAWAANRQAFLVLHLLGRRSPTAWLYLAHQLQSMLKCEWVLSAAAAMTCLSLLRTPPSAAVSISPPSIRRTFSPSLLTMLSQDSQLPSGNLVAG